MPQAQRSYTLINRTAFTQDIADEIVSRLATGQCLADITSLDHMPATSTVYKWLATIPSFAEAYAQARATLVERWADEIVTLADEPVAPNDNAAVQRARLRVDTRKWLMSKLAPRKYGDRVEHVIKSGNAADLTDDELARIAMAAAPALLLTATAAEENYPEPTQNTEAEDKA
jgi:hypothetical protein